jgi:hypothetical protein
MAETSADPIQRPCGPPPPLKVYESLDDLFQDICAHAQANGYSIVKNGKNGNNSRNSRNSCSYKPGSKRRKLTASW